MQKKGIPFYKAKEKFTKGLCGFLAAVTIFGGVTIAKLFKKKTVDDTPTTSSSEQIEAQGLLLAEDFDIDNKEAVRARAKAIYDLSEGQVSIDDIVNIIYIVNERYEKLVLPKGSDSDVIKYLQDLMKNISNLLDDNLQEHVANLTKVIAGKEFKASEKKLIYTYMFMSGQNKEQKNESLAFANYIEKILDSINKGDKQGIESVANEVFAKYKKVSVWLVLDKKGKGTLIATPLSVSDKEEFTKNLNDANKLNEVFAKLLVSLGLSNAEQVYDMVTNDKKPTKEPLGEFYNKKDEEEADKYVKPEEPAGDDLTNDVIVIKPTNPKPPASSETENKVTTETEVEVGTLPGDETYTEVVPGGEALDGVHYSDADSIYIYSKKLNRFY